MLGEFGEAILDPQKPVPNGVVGPGGRPAGRRFDVYRNNVVVSLTEALAAAFPVVKRLVGDDFFNALAGAYVRQDAPSSPLMIYYGETFSRFLREFPPAQQVPYLPDIAALEYARRRAYHAADASPCPEEKLALFQSDRLADLQLTLHPSLEIVQSEFPIFSIWQRNSGDENVEIPQRAQSVLLVRPTDQLIMREIPVESADFLSDLQNTTFGEAANAALTRRPEFDLTANLTELLQANLLVDIN